MAASLVGMNERSKEREESERESEKARQGGEERVQAGSLVK